MMMEVDQSKETGSGATAWSLDHLPNEVLLEILRHLGFWELILYCQISPRWNELCFYLLRDRVTFQLQPKMLAPPEVWTQNRSYRDVSYKDILPSDFDSTCLQPLAEHVKKLDLTFLEAVDGPVVEFLRPFVKVESLVLKIDRLRPRKTRPRFLQACSGILPEVRHLTIRCCYLKLIGLLAELAPRLVTLDLELVLRVFPQFFECQLHALESLTLRLNMTGANGKTISETFPKQKLVQFLSQMKHLRKLGLFVEFFHQAFEVAAALPSIEELTLGGNFWWIPIKTLFNCVYQLPQLHTLSIEVDCFDWLKFGRPKTLPNVTTVKITGTIRIHLPTLARTFPNLKVLAVKPDISTDAELNFAISTWKKSLEVLSIEISPVFIQRTIENFNSLQKIRKISFNFADVHLNDITFLSAIAGKDTLNELHVRGIGGTAWRNALPELYGRFRGSPCTIFIKNWLNPTFTAFW